MIGKVFMARYLIQERIGTGGMSEVYRGLDLNMERAVAVKVLREEFSKDDEFLRRFHREALAAAALSHENLVGVYDLGNENGTVFIVMEYVQGETLKERIRERGALPVEEVIRYGCSLCSAMEHAHAENIIHRDIKPQNIITGLGGAIKLTDFGIARAATSSTVTVTDGHVMGSVHYFSPEQARGEVVAEQSDIYSLGVVLYEMATGRVPFDGDSPVTIALQHLQEPPPDPLQINPDMPVALAKIIKKALKKDVRDRYANAAEMRADLERVKRDPDGGYVRERSHNLEDETRRVPVVRPEEDRPEPVWQDGPESAGKGGEKPPRGRPGKASVLVLLIIVAACAALVWAGIQTVAVLTREQGPIVPEMALVMNEESAKARLNELGLIAAVTYDFSDEHKAGLVIGQEPAAGTEAQRSGVVRLVVSQGPSMVAVPGVVGKQKDEAAELLRSHNLLSDAVPDPNSGLPRGQVVAQEPPEGYELENGSTVKLYYSDPPVMRRAPDVTGMTYPDAEKAVLAAGLVVGKSEQVETTDAEEGRVIRQSPEAKTEVVEGSSVDLYVAIKPAVDFVDHLFDVELNLPDGDCEVSFELQKADGTSEPLFSQMTEGNLTPFSFNITEVPGTYTIAAYVDGVYHDSWTVVLEEKGKDNQ